MDNITYDLVATLEEINNFEEYLKYACDEFWDMVGAEFWNPYKVDFDDYRACVYNKWKDQIIKIALK